MFKIKKCVNRFLAIAVAILLVMNMSIVGVEAKEEGVIPQEQDYVFSGGTITGLTSEFLTSLDETQKQNIKLIIPGEIDGMSVTTIGEYAFSQYKDKYKGIRFTYLDLSNLKELTTIKNYAFYTNSSMAGTLKFSDRLATIGQQAFEQCASLTGDLQLPDSLTSMGTHAFDGCTGLTGSLRLSEGMTTIPDYAFSKCGFTGCLEIPEAVVSIGDSAFRLADKKACFTGGIVIPENVTTIKKYAFLNQNGLTDISFSKCRVDSIKESTFKNTGISGVLRIPEEIKTIESGAFYGTNVETVYLPSQITSVGSSSFDSCSSLNTIICEKENYSTIFNMLSSTAKAKLGYPVTINFDDGNGGGYGSKDCLYNRPYNYCKGNDGAWKPDADYKFPVLTGDANQNKIWGLSADATVAVKESDNVTSLTLHAISVYTKPKITVNRAGVDKVYDGKGEILRVTATHPLAKKKSEAKPGDVVFYYTWTWDTISPPAPDLAGYDENIYVVTDVRQPDYEISCTMYVEARIVGENDTYKAYYAARCSFIINLRQAESTVNPVLDQSVVYTDDNTGQLPKISVSDGDTPGTICWNENQQLTDGFGTYTWTFTPEGNEVGNSNYKIKTGESTIYCAKKNVTKDEIEDKIDNLPELPEESKDVTQEQKNDILDTFLSLETSTSDIKEKIEEEKQNQIYEAVKKLPNVEVAHKTPDSVMLDSTNDLVKNIPAEDILEMKKNDDMSYKLELVAKETEPSKEEKEAIQQAGTDVKLANNYSVTLTKIVNDGANETEEEIAETNHPVKLKFAVPEDLRAAAGNQDFYIIRTHDGGNGITTELLKDEDNDPMTVTVKSDKFSSYTIAYKAKSTGGSGSGGQSYIFGITASASEHGTISPSGTTYAYYGSNKSYQFLPEEGYQVSDVLVDGVSVGAVQSYTFEEVKSSHTIQVVFEKTVSDSDRIKAGVKATTIKLSSKSGKGYVKLSWKKSLGFKVDHYQIFRSTKKNTGYGTKAFYTTKSSKTTTYKNTKKLKKGTRYYYKVRGVRTIDGKKVLTKWSNIVYRIAK